MTVEIHVNAKDLKNATANKKEAHALATSMEINPAVAFA